MKDRKEYGKAYYQAHKEQAKAYKQAHKEQAKAWIEANIQHYRAYQKAYHKDYTKNDLNALGQTKASIRYKSLYYLAKYGTKIPGYQIHHCCTYDDPYKFIYCRKEMHHLIHSYLRQHNIDADSDHYIYIKHLLDDTVVKYNIDD